MDDRLLLWPQRRLFKADRKREAVHSQLLGVPFPSQHRSNNSLATRQPVVTRNVTYLAVKELEG